MLQENMLQQHFSKIYDEEILDPPQNPESIPCSCFVVTQREQGMAANLHHHDEEVSVEEISSSERRLSYSITEEDEGTRQSWALLDFALTPVASPHEEEEVEQRVCEEEAEEEEGEGERGRMQGKMDVRSTLRSTLVDEVRQFSCYSNDTLLHLNSLYNPTIFSLI